MPEPHDLLPRPDPTSLTTEQLHREIGALTDLVEARLSALEKLHEEKFSGIREQFVLRDAAAGKLEAARETAIAAALQAQKEAAGATYESITASIAKSELGFTKQIDGIGALITSTIKSVDDKINDLKGRMDRGEGHGKGLSDGWVWLVGAVGIGALIASFIPGIHQ